MEKLKSSLERPAEVERVKTVVYNEAMNGIGHEFGHYSTQDEIATKDQSVANYTESLLEKHTKKIESKPISEATWNGLLNTSSVINW